MEGKSGVGGDEVRGVTEDLVLKSISEFMMHRDAYRLMGLGYIGADSETVEWSQVSDPTTWSATTPRCAA